VQITDLQQDTRVSMCSYNNNNTLAASN